MYYAHISDGKIIGFGQYPSVDNVSIEITKEQFMNCDDYTYLDGKIVLYPDIKERRIRMQNEQIRQQRQSRFASEADPLKFDYEEALALGDESTEEKKQLWLAKKKQIREELPYISNESNEVIEDDEE